MLETQLINTTLSLQNLCANLIHIILTLQVIYHIESCNITPISFFDDRVDNSLFAFVFAH